MLKAHKYLKKKEGGKRLHFICAFPVNNYVVHKKYNYTIL